MATAVDDARDYNLEHAGVGLDFGDPAGGAGVRLTLLSVRF